MPLAAAQGSKGAEPSPLPAAVFNTAWAGSRPVTVASQALPGTVEAFAAGAGRAVLEGGAQGLAALANSPGSAPCLKRRYPQLVAPGSAKPGRADGVLLEGRPRPEVDSSGRRTGGRETCSPMPWRFPAAPHRNVKTTLGGDSHLGPPAIHAVAASHPQARGRLAPRCGPATGDRFAVGAPR